MNKIKLILIVLLSTCSLVVHSKVYYVAPTGSDGNAGTISAPFLTVQRAHTAVAAGDTVYIRGGSYLMQESQIFEKTTGTTKFAYVTKLTKSGTAGKRINYWAYPGERPVFDFSNVRPADHRINAFEVTGSWMHIKGLEVVGVQVTIAQNINTQSICFSQNASSSSGGNNIYEELSMHDGMAIGFYLSRGSNVLVLNCDAYNNWDNVSGNKAGGNVDGFGAHPNRDTYTGIVFRGCRAWFNSDDGFDIISSYAPITLENCWAFYNGYSTAFESLGNGIGFKMGGFGTSTSPSVPAVIPRHTVRYNLSVGNKSSGFYANHHLGGNDWYNNTAYMNWENFNMLNRSPDYTQDVPGYDHVLRNNVSYLTRSDRERHLITDVDETKCTINHNTFLNPAIGTPTAADFLSLDISLLTQPRKPSGDLPDTDFMVPAPESKLIDAGIDVGLPFDGNKPDLGYKETAAVVMQEQTITFNPLAPKTVEDTDFDAGAIASSGLAVTYSSSDEAVATIVDGKIHIVGAGTTDITVTQEGNEQYLAAQPVVQRLSVTKLYYVDADGDGFGSQEGAAFATEVTPAGYATNNQDCDDSKILYADNDGDGLGAGEPVACGVANNDDCDDTNPVQLIASIPDVYVMNPAVDKKNTIYIGYGPSSLTIEAVPAGGTAPFTYEWNTGTATQSLVVNEAGTYVATVTDAKGCKTTASIVISTLNVECGNNNDKVMVCHNGKSICIASEAVLEHLKHGDVLGDCSTTTNSATTQSSLKEAGATDAKVLLYPNPVTDNLSIELTAVTEGATVIIYNATGAVVLSRNLTGSTNTISLKDLYNGIYYVKINTGQKVITEKLVKENSF